MWQKFKKGLHRHFIPSSHNAFRPRILHRSWLLFFLALTLGTEGFLVSSLLARQSSENFLAAVVPGEIIALTNSERQQNDVGTLIENKDLDVAAQAKAEDMAQKGYFSHISPNGEEPWDWITAAGYNYQYAGENLAVRFTDSNDVVNAWMASPTHRANIIKPQYTNIGVGVADGIYQGEPATFVVQYFGAPEPGQVLGAEVGPIPTQFSAHSLLQSVERQFARLAAEPRDTAQLVLGAVAIILLLALALAFFIHIQIQPTQMLAGGMVVAGLAVVLLAANSTLLSATVVANNSTAAAALAGSGVVIGDGASTQR